MGRFDTDYRISDLLFRLTVLKKKVAAFESGEQYRRMEERHAGELSQQNREIQRLRNELSSAHAQVIDVRNKWFDTCEDLIKEHKRERKRFETALKRAESRELEALRQRDEAIDKLHRKNEELYEVKTRLLEAEEKIKALTARCRQDYTNSSVSSSMSPNHKKIKNNRVPSGKKTGAQTGHPHHGRKKHTPDREISIPAPEEFKNPARYTPTGKTIRRQLVLMEVNTRVIEYSTPEYQDRKTGKKVHAPFPEGVKDDVNYDGTIKAFAYLLNNECFVSIDKTRRFLKEISRGNIDISNGMICNLSRQFSELTEDERNLIFKGLLASDSMHADFTFGRKYGKQATVLICATDDLALYQAKDKKGLEGVKDSPVEAYTGTVISDHESVFLNYGDRHQECLVHIERKLRAITEMEKEKQWASEMLGWIQSAIHYWKQVRSGEEEYDPDKVKGYEDEYDRIVLKAKEEYEYEPPSALFRDGFNLYKRLAEDKDGHVLFLRDTSIEPNNNRAEQLARQFKRKARQVMCFRSDTGVAHFCDGLSVLNTLKTKGENLYEKTSAIFITHAAEPGQPPGCFATP